MAVTLTLSLHRGRSIDGSTGRTLSGDDLVVGSGADAGWRIEGTAARHCQFGHRGGRWLVVDLAGDAGGGTAVNGRRLDGPVPLASGDSVTFGPCTLLVGPSAQAGDAAALVAAAGLDRARLGGDDAAVLANAGVLLRTLVAGLVAQVADRARAKAELGAEATMLAIGRTNPLKALPADRALAALLASPAGTMAAAEAVAEAFGEVASHHAATLAGMQAALAATLDRFSPAAIRARAAGGGLLSRVLPGSREATLWQAYEREFDGVAKGSSDAFVELFAQEFARAYRTAAPPAAPPAAAPGRLSSAPRLPS
jgi:predicted component of type VI protein secretion system